MCSPASAWSSYSSDVLPHSGPTLLYVISLLAAANVAGILAFFAPAGLGVREAVLVAGLAPYLSAGDALGIAAILRVLTLLADLIFVSLTGGVALLARRRRAGSENDGSYPREAFAR